MADIRLSKKRLETHFQYSWWKYALALVISVLGISMIFDMTEYRPPEDKKVELYLLNGFAYAEQMEEVFWPLLKEACPEQEEMIAMNINLLSDDMYIRMQYSTYIAAHQGDVMLMPSSEYQNLISEDPADSIFVDLTPYIESGIINPGDIDLTPGVEIDSQGKEGIFGIPADSLKGFEDYMCDPTDSLLVMMSYGGNLDTSAVLVGLLIDNLK